MTVVETPLFLRKAESILDEEERARLVAAIGTDPEAGEIIPGTGGVRKLRWALPGRGKSGGARVIYYFHNADMPLVMLSIYAKNAKLNFTQSERNELKRLIPELVQELREGRRR
ncbi:MAG: type II toxin-antitoxin system RelE/ParE family toxin [Bryobacterales bacterium]|nr:type II toxin-antitoxin system RelE/ParE family toxin [Bryobacterales bacterium]